MVTNLFSYIFKGGRKGKGKGVGAGEFRESSFL